MVAAGACGARHYIDRHEVDAYIVSILGVVCVLLLDVVVVAAAAAAALELSFTTV